MTAEVILQAASSHHFYAGATGQNAGACSLDLGLPTGGAGVLGTLADLNLLSSFLSKGIVAGPYLPTTLTSVHSAMSL